MPWAERNLMSLRAEFVQLAKTSGITMTALCRRFGISRKTGHKWLRRYAAAVWAVARSIKLKNDQKAVLVQVLETDTRTI